MKTAMATKISSAWRRFYNWAAYRRIVHSSITCQALARRFLDSKIHKKLKHERCMTAATRIESATRGFVARKYFMILKSGTILVQSLSRRRVASRCLNELKEQQRMLEEEKATKIVAIWKGFRVRSGYIVIVLGMFPRVEKLIIILRCYFISADDFIIWHLHSCPTTRKTFCCGYNHSIFL